MILLLVKGFIKQGFTAENAESAEIWGRKDVFTTESTEITE